MTRVYSIKRIKKKRPRRPPDAKKLNSDTTIQDTLEFCEKTSSGNKGVKD